MSALTEAATVLTIAEVRSAVHDIIQEMADRGALPEKAGHASMLMELRDWGTLGARKAINDLEKEFPNSETGDA